MKKEPNQGKQKEIKQNKLKNEAKEWKMEENQTNKIKQNKMR